MISKNLNGVLGYGYTVEEADEDCLITSVLQDACNISSSKELLNRRMELSPWIPRKGSLHIHNIGYIKTVIDSDTGTSELTINSIKSPITSNLWETLYNSFYEKLSMVDIVVCGMEFEKLFKEIDAYKYKSISLYPKIFPDEVVYEDPNISSLTLIDDFYIASYDVGKISIKRSNESHYWSCVYDINSFKPLDILFYISYAKKYSDVNSIIVRSDT